MAKEVSIKARYGLKHKFTEVAENVWRTSEFSRFSFSTRDNDGIYHDVTYIDFDGGPFMHIADTCPWDTGKKIKEFILHQEGDKIPYIDIVLE